MFMSRQLVKKVNPIPTVEGRFCPPFSSGTSNIFHLPASLIKQQTGLLLATLQQLNELQFLHHFILMPKKPSQEFSMQTFDSGTILVYTHNPLILKIFSKLSKYIFYRKSPPHYLHNDISQRSINFFVNFCFGNKIFLPYFVTLVKKYTKPVEHIWRSEEKRLLVSSKPQSTSYECVSLEKCEDNTVRS